MIDTDFENELTLKMKTKDTIKYFISSPHLMLWANNIKKRINDQAF